MRSSVICVGSPFGEDCLGFVAAPLLEAALAPLGVPVTVADRPGPRLVLALEGREEVILVDGVVSGRPPGTLHRLEEEAVLRALARHTSTHGFGLADALALSRRLGGGPRRWVLHGVEIGTGRAEAHLRPAVRAALPALVAAVKAELEGARR